MMIEGHAQVYRDVPFWRAMRGLFYVAGVA